MKMTPSSASIEPTERSMPLVMMTKPWPMEIRPNRPTRLAVFDKLIGEMKRGLRNATMPATTIRRMRRPRSFFSMAVPSMDAAAALAAGMADGELHDRFLAEAVSGQDAGDRALVHDRHPVADPDHFFHVARDHEYADAVVGEAAHQ